MLHRLLTLALSVFIVAGCLGEAWARTRIRVTPIYPYRYYSTTYPVPYKYEYPGPGAVRQCRSWLAPENRVSGPVITPQMRCWWVR
jgi:hypothetical protein